MATPKMSNRKRQPALQARIDKTRADAHQEVVTAGKIQFRLDAETMELLLRMADQRCTGAGVLARMWVVERLEAELSGATDATRDLDRRLRVLESEIGRYSVSGKKPRRTTRGE